MPKTGMLHNQGDGRVLIKNNNNKKGASLAVAGIALASAVWAGAAWAADEPASIAPDSLPGVAEIQNRAKTGTGAYEYVESLTTQVGPRLPGTPNDAAAVAWALKAMTDLGLSNVHAEPVPMQAWVRGEEHAAIVKPIPQPLAVAALGGSVGTPAEGIEAPVARFATFADLLAVPAGSLKGKIAYVAQQMTRAQDGAGYGDAVAMRIGGPSAAAKAGALAVLIRSVGTDHHRSPHTGVTHYEDGVPRIPAAALSTIDADQLDRLLAQGPVSLSLRLGAHEGGPITTYNVVGDLPGSKRPQDIVLVGAHLDSWDQGTGAIDDGAGVGIALGAVKVIKSLPLKPRRTIRVVLFAAEEEGLIGGAAYGKAHAAQAGDYVLGTEADLGAGPVWSFRIKHDASTKPAVDEIARALHPLHIVRGRNEQGGSSDLGPLSEAGMPVLELDLDASQYFDIHHTAEDTLDKVDRATIDQSTAAYATVLWLAAQSSGTFRTQDAR